MAKTPKNFEKVVLILAKKLKGQPYAIRGTASLVLQGIEMNVDDIDIVCNKKTALACNDLLKEYLVEKVAYKESEKFKSHFGKFEIEGVPVEVMGEWKVGKKGPFDGNQKIQIQVQDQRVWLTTIDSELEMFSAMGRWNAYWKIKKQVEKKSQPALL